MLVLVSLPAASGPMHRDWVEPCSAQATVASNQAFINKQKRSGGQGWVTNYPAARSTASNAERLASAGAAAGSYLALPRLSQPTGETVAAGSYLALRPWSSAKTCTASDRRSLWLGRTLHGSAEYSEEKGVKRQWLGLTLHNTSPPKRRGGASVTGSHLARRASSSNK